LVLKHLAASPGSICWRVHPKCVRREKVYQRVAEDAALALGECPVGRMQERGIKEVRWPPPPYDIEHRILERKTHPFNPEAALKALIKVQCLFGAVWKIGRGPDRCLDSSQRERHGHRNGVNIIRVCCDKYIGLHGLSD
jgi:hypothetical protein